METTEKIVEAYARYVKGWFTIPNINCGGQMEIDLLAIDASNPRKIRRYHIESGISISGAYSKLTSNPYSSDDLKVRVKQAGQRRTLEYFTERKFGNPNVVEKLRSFGFEAGNYTKVIVSWDWKDDVPDAAKQVGVELWNFKDVLITTEFPLIPGKWIGVAILFYFFGDVFNLGFNRRWGRWPQYIFLVLLGLAVIVDFMLYGKFWGPPAGWLIFLLQQFTALVIGVGFLLSAALAAPG